MTTTYKLERDDLKNTSLSILHERVVNTQRWPSSGYLRTAKVEVLSPNVTRQATKVAAQHAAIGAASEQ